MERDFPLPVPDHTAVLQSSFLVPPFRQSGIPPCRRQVRFHGRHRMARAGLVSGRSAARRNVTVRAHRDAALAIGNPRLQPPTITAAGAWVATGVSLAAQVLGSVPGVSAAAAVKEQSLAPSTM
jgi:hypothetical protein